VRFSGESTALGIGEANASPTQALREHAVLFLEIREEPFRIVGSDQLERRTGILEKNGFKAQLFIFNNLLFGSTSTLQRDIFLQHSAPHRF